ncbi:MAG: hypothetical protein QM804_14735 [Propionicimonas sp.]
MWFSSRGDRLLTKVEAISIAQLEGYPLSVRTFDRLLLTGQAPAAQRLVGAEPLWSEALILEWSQGQLPEALAAEADRLLTAGWEDQTPDGLPELGTVTLADDVPTHLAVLWAERHLLDELRSLTAERESYRSELADGGRPRRWVAGRLRRVRELDALEARIQADLRTCSSWVMQLLRWSQAELPRRRKLALEDADIATERRQRGLDLAELQVFRSSREFVSGDPRRATPRAVETSERVRLEGLHLSHHWRLDATDRDAPGRYPNGPGTWRVSWNPANRELYGYEEASEQVLLIGRLPTPVDRQSIVDWIEPISARQPERNSLALVVELFAAQQRAGFPSLAPPQPAP